MNKQKIKKIKIEADGTKDIFINEGGISMFIHPSKDRHVMIHKVKKISRKTKTVNVEELGTYKVVKITIETNNNGTLVIDAFLEKED